MESFLQLPFRAMQAVLYIRTLYAFTNETLAKYSYATSLQATLRYGILISLVQGLGLGFTYGLAICSCALQLWVGRFLVTHGKAHGGEIITALFAVILSGLWVSLSHILPSSLICCTKVMQFTNASIHTVGWIKQRQTSTLLSKGELQLIGFLRW